MLDNRNHSPNRPSHTHYSGGVKKENIRVVMEMVAMLKAEIQVPHHYKVMHLMEVTHDSLL